MNLKKIIKNFWSRMLKSHYILTLHEACAWGWISEEEFQKGVKEIEQDDPAS